jgi:hypothetical protein
LESARSGEFFGFVLRPEPGLGVAKCGDAAFGGDTGAGKHGHAFGGGQALQQFRRNPHELVDAFLGMHTLRLLSQFAWHGKSVMKLAANEAENGGLTGEEGVLDFVCMGGDHDKARLAGTGLFSRPRPRRTIGALVILLFLGLVWLLPGQLTHVPVYRGKALTVWLQTYDPTSPFVPGSREWNETDDAVRHIGTNAAPIFLQMLRVTDSRLKLRLVELAQRQRVIKIHFVPAATRNIEASRAFIVLGDAAKDAVPDLMKIYEENNSSDSQSAVEDALSWIGPGAKAALPLLLRATTNSSSQVRANALWALGDIQGEPALCVPVLIRALGDTDGKARSSAEHALEKIGSDARAAIPSLMELKKLTASALGRGVSSPASIDAYFALRNALNRGLFYPLSMEAYNALRKIDPKIPGEDPLLPPR